MQSPIHNIIWVLLQNLQRLQDLLQKKEIKTEKDSPRFETELHNWLFPSPLPKNINPAKKTDKRETNGVASCACSIVK